MDMRAVDVLTNLKNWPAYDYKAYKLDKNEANPCINALENYIWHEVEKEGMPKEDGFYLFKTKKKDLDDQIFYGYTALYYIKYTVRLVEKIDAIAWRKIIDEEDAYYE